MPHLWGRVHTTVFGAVFSLAEAAASSLKASQRLLAHPLHHPHGVVTIRQIVIERGEAVRLAARLHFLKLLLVEVVLAHNAPIEGGRIHGETWRQRAIDADNHV